MNVKSVHLKSCLPFHLPVVRLFIFSDGLYNIGVIDTLKGETFTYQNEGCVYHQFNS